MAEERSSLKIDVQRSNPDLSMDNPANVSMHVGDLRINQSDSPEQSRKMFFQKNEQELAEVMNTILALKELFETIFQKSMDEKTELVPPENVALLVGDMI